MKKLYGIWIDHAGAHVVKANEKDIESVQYVRSGVGPHHHSGEVVEHLTMTDPKSDENRRHEKMHKYAKEIMEMIHDGDEIAIFGPSTAKFELRKAYEKKVGLAEKIVFFETVDKMTENQLRAYVKDIFDLPREY